MVVCTGLADNAAQSVEGQRRSASVEQAAGIFSSIIGETSVTHRWVVSARLLEIMNDYRHRRLFGVIIRMVS